MQSFAKRNFFGVSASFNTKSMTVHYYSESSIALLQNKLHHLAAQASVKAIMLLAADNSTLNTTALDALLKSIKKPIFGGLFPGLILKEERIEKGFIVVTFSFDVTLLTIKNISSSEEDTTLHLLEKAPSFTECKTMFVFIDGLAKGINSFIENLFSIFGLEFNYIGGGAGSLSLKQQPCLFTNKGILQDAAILVGTNRPSGIGVKHGWHSISGPYKITQAEGTEIKELDYKPAFDTYKEVIDHHSGKSINTDNFFEIAKAYPFGIKKVDAEEVVRDPIKATENKSLVCVGEVEIGSFINILHGDQESLIAAASTAATQAIENLNSEQINTVFFVDCISRVLFLQENFSDELSSVYKRTKSNSLFGILSLGEIANSRSDYLEFYNKTSVVCCF